jgi:hypothetical protein
MVLFRLKDFDGALKAAQQLRNAKRQQRAGGRSGAVKALEMECFEDKRIFESTSPDERRGPGGAKWWWGQAEGRENN